MIFSRALAMLSFLNQHSFAFCDAESKAKIFSYVINFCTPVQTDCLKTGLIFATISPKETFPVQ